MSGNTIKLGKGHKLPKKWHFIMNLESGLEGDLMYSEMRIIGRRGKRKKRRVFVFATADGKTRAITKEQLEKYWRPD